MSNKKLTKKQMINLRCNERKCIMYLSTAKHIADRLMKDKSILQNRNPNWKCLSNYFNYCLLRDFGANRSIKDKEQELKDQIKILRQELNEYVSESNKATMFFEDQLSMLQSNNRVALGILNKPKKYINKLMGIDND